MSKRINYSAFASFISSCPDTLALKRFQELHIRNLLYYQAELSHLNVELEEIEQLDAARNPDPSKRANFRWSPLTAQDNSSATLTPPIAISTLYSQKILQIRATLKNYSDAVEQYRRLNDIPHPKRFDMLAICDWLNGMYRGANFLAGDVEDVWNVRFPNGASVPADVADFYGFEDNNNLTFRIGTFFALLARTFRRRDNTSQAHHIDTGASGSLDKTISTVIASILPVIPILVLYFIERLLVRIGLILVFTAVFAALLVLGLQLKPDTTLAITTAIAAIQVVYVGSTANSTSS